MVLPGFFRCSLHSTGQDIAPPTFVRAPARRASRQANGHRLGRCSVHLTNDLADFVRAQVNVIESVMLEDIFAHYRYDALGLSFAIVADINFSGSWLARIAIRPEEVDVLPFETQRSRRMTLKDFQPRGHDTKYFWSSRAKMHIRNGESIHG